MTQTAIRGQRTEFLDPSATRTDWTEMGAGDHFVQFYEADAFLLDSLAGFIGSGLRQGDSGIVIATPEHQKGLSARLEADGVDVSAAIAEGRYVPLDAAETLSKFMVEGRPDAGRFAAAIGPVLAAAMRPGRGVRAFGEMVALLWAQKNQAGAIHLEQLWNEIARTYEFALFCAYPLKEFGESGHGEPLAHICAHHTRVIPSESYAALDTRKKQLLEVTLLQQKAAALQAEVAARRAAEGARELLLISERAARTEAERSNRMKDEFVATLSHELRTPLTSILGWAQLLRKGAIQADEVKGALETIERNARAQAQMIEELLDISRIESGKLRLNVQAVDVGDVVRAALEAVKPAADAKAICVQAALDPDATLVGGDPTRLQQIAWNLLSNAVKFTGKGGSVRVELRRIASHVQFVVSDSGKGIRPEFLPHVFSRFRQEDSSITRRYGGLGLGLSIVKNMVELHGGVVGAASEGEGLGATFTVELPLMAVKVDGAARPSCEEAEVRSTPSSVPGAALTGPILEGVKILVVDDDAESRRVIARVLAGAGAIVETAGSAEEAMVAFLARRPHVLLSDIGMPDMDGYDLARWVRSLHPEQGGQTPAAALTALARSEDRTRALLAGYQAHIPKPIESSELIAAAASLAAVSFRGTLETPRAGHDALSQRAGGGERGGRDGEEDQGPVRR